MSSSEFKIERAQRAQVKLRVALQGPSGSGKTATMLLLARGMVEGLRARGKLPEHLDGCYVGVLDTENDSASLYDHLVPFDRIVLRPPFTVDRYLGALSELIKVGYPVIGVDQISHEWSGPGGILDQVSHAKGLNDFAKWNGPSQDHDRFLDFLLHCPAHLILTMRAKTAYVLEKKVGKDGRERETPTRVGMAPQQRAGSEYEFTTLLDLAIDHEAAGKNAATCLKDRMQVFEGSETYPRLGERAGLAMMDWVYSASKPVAESEVAPEVRARAMAEAGKRAIAAAPNLPDLQVVYVAEVKQMRAFSVQAGQDVVVPLLADLAAAKDARKLALEGRDSSVLVRDLAPGEADRPPKDPPPADPLAKALEITERIANERPGLFSPQPETAGGFADMEDDLPWKD